MKSIRYIMRYGFIIFFIAAFIFSVSCKIFNISGNDSVKAGGQSQQQSSASSIESTTETTLASEKNNGSQELSEKPDEAVFKEYFSELGLGKLPENGALLVDLKKGDSVFVSNGKDQLVIYGSLLKDTKLSNAIYDINARKNIRDKAEFPMVMKKGGFAGSEPVTIPAGKYEYKIWIGDKLVGVFPFEVKP